MGNLKNKKILIAISGGIAAYKINTLVRMLVKENALVQVIMTPIAEKFISKNTISVLSKNPVFSDFFSQNGTWINHVELALWADLILVAPCTANTLAKMANGICDNLVIAVYLSAKCPVFIAPAMDLDMYAHPSTKENLQKLSNFGNIIIPPEDGELASGLSGTGRMAEPENIFTKIENVFETNKNQNWYGKTILVTAGPTYEAIDPVRFIGNHSSGKMGFSIAEDAAKRGAKVILVSGPTSLEPNHKNIKIIRVTSAKEMYQEVFKYYDQVTVAIATAAVADYAPKEIANEKIKKNDQNLILELVKNPDILKEMGERKKKQILVGFALETENEIENAQKKRINKNLDFIVLNSLRDSGAGFQKHTNKIKIITESKIVEYPLQSKELVASEILDYIESIW